MATKKKTIIVASLYTFTDVGANELIQIEKDAHDDPETAPFFYYDASKAVFCAEVPQEDNQTMRDMLARKAGYIEYQQSAPPALDDEPRIRPMPGTMIQDLIPEDIMSDPPLLKYDSDTESSDGDALGPMQHLTAYWKPRCGRINILPPMYANAITELTGSSLFAEEAEKRYRIFQGNFQLALQKLLHLESLLEAFESQAGISSHRATGNLLVWPPNQQDGRLEYINMSPDHPSYHRVIVNRQEQTLSRKVLGELRTLAPRTRVLEVPHNLQYIDISSTAEVQASKIWDGRQYPSFGDPGNMVPIVTDVPTSADNNQTAPTNGPADDRITAWTNTVVPSANPNVAPEAPVEPVAPVRRMLIADSDSEDDGPPVRRNEPVPTINQKVTPAPLIQLSDDGHLPHDKEQPDPEFEAPLSLPRVGGVNTLIDLSEDNTWAQNLVAHNIEPLSPALNGDVTFRTAIEPRSKTPIVRQGFDVDADILEQLEVVDTSVPYQEAALGGTGTTSKQTTLAAESPEHASLQDEVLATVSESPPTPPLTRPTFDPNAYRSSPPASRGRGGRGNQRARGQRGQFDNRSRGGNRGGRTPNNNRANDSRPDRTPTRAPARGGPSRGHAGTRATPSTSRAPTNRGTRGNGPPYNQRDLVDIQTLDQTGHVPAVPPGFESITPLMPENASRDPSIPPGFESSLNQIPAAATYRNATHPQSPEATGPPETGPARSHLRSNATSGSSTSGRSRSTRWKFSDEGSGYVTTQIPKPDYAALRDKILQDAMAAAAGNNKKADEAEPPRKYSTMRQQARNPGKNFAKGSTKQETAAEAAARRQRALEEAYGPTPSAPLPRLTPSSPNVGAMSEWKKKQLKKNTPMAEAHPEIVGDNLRDQQTSKLISLLQPIFETGRALKGKLNFEIQVGQVLVVPGQQVRDKTFHSVDDWKSYFDVRGSSHTFSTFTKILTSNGADIDRALELKGLGRSGNVKLWDSTPSSMSVSYEFQCQSRSNEDFQIVIDELGGYEIRRGQITVGAVSIHVPAQIWDLSATLSAPMKWWDAPETVAQSASAFRDSLYVMPDDKKLVLYFRPPNDREIKIRNLIVKRVSYHPSNRPDGKDIFLKVTEAKNLQFRVHPQDKTLWVAYDPGVREQADYKLQVADAGRIHYELSVVHTGINDSLAGNEILEIGELTDAETTGKSLLDRSTMRSMLDTAVQLVSKIDYIGMWNYGTQRRLIEEENIRQAKLLAELGPRARTLHPPGTSIMRGSNTGGSGMRTVTGNNTSLPMVEERPIPGVRMNTIAEIMVDESGNRYRYGMGGSRIPIAEDAEPLDSAMTVAPDDSASQAGNGPKYGVAHSSERGQLFW